ncbi:eukaryotic translation initiation factor 4 gamma 3-like [Hydra vulgaris]|uniref:Eukaryotic translation initiation factor 4 gamma 3-like n=1 Tax=Hydra vulgaris TaxID=6087 RepID=A0ABM4BYU1_HYDVU
MSKIIDYRYISTKIKFEIRNIIDHIDCNWVEKRDELNLKTFDQIKNEAKKEQEKEKAIPPYKMKPEEGKRKKQKKMTNFKDTVRDSSDQSGIGLSLSSNSLTNIQSKQKHFISETIDKNESNNISFGSNVGSSISSHSNRSRRRSRNRSRSHFVDTSIECTRQNQTDYHNDLNEQIQSKNRIKKKDLTWEAYRIYRSKHPGPLTEKSFQWWVRYDGIDDPSFKWREKKINVQF